MELDRGHLHRPDDAGQLRDTQLVGMPVVSGKAHPDRLKPRRGTVRHPLLVDLLAADALGEPMHHARPITQRPDDAISDAQVVAGQVELGLPAGREVDPVRIGDPHHAVTDLQLGCWGLLDCWGLAARNRHIHKLTSRDRVLQCPGTSDPANYMIISSSASLDG